jgi:hypothetical protein
MMTCRISLTFKKFVDYYVVENCLLGWFFSFYVHVLGLGYVAFSFRCFGILILNSFILIMLMFKFCVLQYVENLTIFLDNILVVNFLFSRFI